jgi:hypothetical protein
MTTTRKSKPKIRICQKCQQKLPHSLFEGKGTTCLFCRFSGHNPLASELEQKTALITALMEEKQQLQENLERSVAQAPKLLRAQELEFLGALQDLRNNTPTRKGSVKKSVYFQTFEQAAAMRWLANKLNVDASLATSLFFELTMRSWSPKTQTRIAYIAKEEQDKATFRKQLKKQP